MRHALFVAFHFPPEASSSGVLRTLKYTRFLPEFGWRVSVLTVDPAAYEICDARLEAQVPPETRVVRTRFRNTKRDYSWRGIYPALLALPDVWIGWVPFALRAGRRLLADDPADIVYSTSPHATAHLIAGRLAARARTPWVIDFRDPWYEDVPEPGAPSGPIYRSINRWLERRVVTRADAVVTSTTHLRDLMRDRYPDAADTKVQAILNGYDEADFVDVEPTMRAAGERLRIVHAGSINPAFRDPRPLFAALGRLIDAGDLGASECEVRFLGAGPFGESAEVRAAIATAGLSGSVNFLPRVPYETSLQELASADLLLLLQASDDTVGLVPAKLYEYLRSQKPTLALVRHGAVSEVLQQTGGGWAVDPNDAPALARTVAAVVGDWRADRLPQHVADLVALRKFDRRALTAQLARLFEQLDRRGTSVPR